MRIGNPDSVMQRVESFVARVREYVGKEPEVIVLFAEDYDAIDTQRYEGKYRFVRGPSVSEYQ